MTKIFVAVDDEKFEATGELLEQLEADRAQVEANKIALEQSIAQTQAAKSNALAKLAALGLTQEELKALGL
jgi:hypothetical protein